MIDLFRTWLPQIISTAEEFQDGRLERSWGQGERYISAYYSGELYEQIFGDLDADAMLMEARVALEPHPTLVEALANFLGSLKQLDAWIEAHVDTATWGKGQSIPGEVSDIFHSDEWRAAHVCAAGLVSVASGVGFGSRDLDLTRATEDRNPTLH